MVSDVNQCDRCDLTCLSSLLKMVTHFTGIVMRKRGNHLYVYGLQKGGVVTRMWCYAPHKMGILYTQKKVSITIKKVVVTLFMQSQSKQQC